MLGGFVTQAQEMSKADYCRFFEKNMQEVGWTGAYVDYTSDILQITIPLETITKIMNEVKRGYYTNSNVRANLEEDEKGFMNTMQKGMVNELSKVKGIFNGIGFYRVQVFIEDDFVHSFKKYKSNPVKF